MILCCCTGTSDRELRAQVRAGARDLESLGEATGAGACCGGCRPMLRELLRDEAAAAGASGGCARLELRSEDGAASPLTPGLALTEALSVACARHPQAP